MKLDVNYYRAINKESKKVLVFVGGDGDDKNSFLKAINHLAEKLPNYNFCSFTYTYVVAKNKKQLHCSATDLQLVIDYLINNLRVKEINLFCTSKGAYGTSYLLVNLKYKNLIKEVIFCDPADYYLNSEKLVKKGAWSGSEKYQPKAKTVSSLLKKIKGKVKVNVIHFMLRNHGPNGYEEKDYQKRGQDNPKLFPRLNTKMVKKFYQNLPKKNQGKYIEDHQIPHGIKRDGDLKKNQLNLSNLILKCFT